MAFFDCQWSFKSEPLYPSGGFVFVTSFTIFTTKPIAIDADIDDRAMVQQTG